ncbi:MAG TPA: hypothetical protein VLV83_20045 [Acidobacteriota bacterium]|nr:hypothetical protein [Acidobacteriota bacterium]
MRLAFPRLDLKSFLLWLAAASALISLASATSLRPLNLQDLVQHSSRIFQGICLSQHQGVDERGLPYTAYTFRVEEVWAGEAGPETLTIRQFGLSAEAPVEAERNQIRIAAMPHYQPGQRYLLFLPQDSRWGFASPVGLLQGAFHVLGEGGQRVAVNGVGNLNLTLDTAKTPSQRLRNLSPRAVGRALQGPVTYESLRQVVQRLASGEEMAASEMARALRPGGRR